MNLKDNLTFLIIAIFILFLSNACGKDDKFVPACDGSMPTYDADIKSIINANCTSAPCHGSGSVNGDWTTYAGMTTVLNNGQFEKQVLTDMTMPQGSATLSEAQLNLIRCWADNNYPEN